MSQSNPNLLQYVLKVNDINFENMSNDDAVRVLREIVHKPGWVLDNLRVLSSLLCTQGINNDYNDHCLFARPIILTVAKCWDPSPQGYFTLPRSKCTTASFSVYPPLADFLGTSNSFLMSSSCVQMNRSDPLTQQRGWATLWLWLGLIRPSQAALPSAPSPLPPPSPRLSVRASFQRLPHCYLIFCVASFCVSQIFNTNSKYLLSHVY